MPQSLSQIYIHLVFSTKDRKNLISETIAPELYAYLATIFNDVCRSPATLIGGVEDHSHVLFNLARTWCVADVVKEVKINTSKWMKKQDSMLRQFEWQTGYGAFSVSKSNLWRVEKYIHGQREHHHRQSFKDEFRGLLKRHEVEYDERYVWD